MKKSFPGHQNGAQGDKIYPKGHPKAPQATPKPAQWAPKGSQRRPWRNPKTRAVTHSFRSPVPGASRDSPKAPQRPPKRSRGIIFGPFSRYISNIFCPYCTFKRTEEEHNTIERKLHHTHTHSEGVPSPRQGKGEVNTSPWRIGNPKDCIIGGSKPEKVSTRYDQGSMD